jgi:hypothetical protein
MAPEAGETLMARLTLLALAIGILPAVAAAAELPTLPIEATCRAAKP